MINIIEYIKISTIKTVTYLLTLIVSSALFILCISVIINGCYKIKNGYLYSCFGIIRTKTNLDNIISITHYKKTDKLVLFFKSAEFSVIIISPKDYEDFILSLKQANPRIIYEQNSTIDSNA